MTTEQINIEENFYGGHNMSKKTAIIISVILFVILCALIVCEKMWPTAGANLLIGTLG